MLDYVMGDDFDDDNDIVVLYAGAAPGEHIALLADWFPSVRFELFDGRSFSSELDSRRNVRTHAGYLTESSLRKFCESDTVACDKGKVQRRYLISDIRSVDPADKELSMSAVDDGVLADMRLQESWVRTGLFCVSMLKFRLPYTVPGRT